MSGIEAPSLVGYLMLLLTYRNAHAVRDSLSNVKQLYGERYSFVTGLALILLFPSDAPRLVGRIERVLQAEPAEAKEFVKSLASGFNLIGVAGAIVAQVAITGVSFGVDDDFSWTVTACYIIGLVCAAFSVYFACVVHPAFTGLDDPTMIRVWLGQPVRSHGLKTHADQRERFASAYAVMMILAPSRLLNIAIGSLLIGYGIHLGLVYTSRASPGFNLFPSLAVLIVYICTGVYALGLFFFPRGLKEVEVQDEPSSSNARQGQDMYQSPSSTMKNQNSHTQPNHHPSGPHDAATAERYPQVSASKTTEIQSNIWRINTDASQNLDHNSVAETVIPGASTADISKNLESILQELIIAQDNNANITRKLLEFHQRYTQ